MENKGFFGGLFDLSFTEFVTTRVIKVLYILAILISAIVALILLISGIAKGGGMAFLAIIVSPIVFFLYVLMARIWLEVIIVLFRIAENTGRLVEHAEKSAAAH
ncbi:MAG TPA: DUF4282 domain-containing protein [Sedimentisphaerales bacterium]|nr:DUF4282 domain-containing protein [Sedimentisphaerales bacterium]